MIDTDFTSLLPHVACWCSHTCESLPCTWALLLEPHSGYIICASHTWYRIRDGPFVSMIFISFVTSLYSSESTQNLEEYPSALEGQDQTRNVVVYSLMQKLQSMLHWRNRSWINKEKRTSRLCQHHISTIYDQITMHGFYQHKSQVGHWWPCALGESCYWLGECENNRQRRLAAETDMRDIHHTQLRYCHE